MLRDIVSVQVSLIAKLQGILFERRKLSAAEFSIGSPLYDSISAQKWYKSDVPGKERVQQGGPLYDRMLAQNNIKHCTRKTNH